MIRGTFLQASKNYLRNNFVSEINSWDSIGLTLPYNNQNKTTQRLTGQFS